MGQMQAQKCLPSGTLCSGVEHHVDGVLGPPLADWQMMYCSAGDQYRVFKSAQVVF